MSLLKVFTEMTTVIGLYLRRRSLLCDKIMMWTMSGWSTRARINFTTYLVKMHARASMKLCLITSYHLSLPLENFSRLWKATNQRPIEFATGSGGMPPCLRYNFQAYKNPASVTR